MVPFRVRRARSGRKRRHIQLPPHVSVTPETIAAICARHGLGSQAFTRLPDAGIINAIYRLGDTHALRVPRNHPKHIEQTKIEAVAAPVATAAGVRTHRLVAFDETRDLIPVPYTIFEWVPGRPLEHAGLMRLDVLPAWRDVGRDLARLHAVERSGPAAALADAETLPDPRELVEQRASQGWFTTLEAAWLQGWLERLAAAAREKVPSRLLHLDTQATNVITQLADDDYAAIIDWGCAGWGDEAFDFCMPLRFVPEVIAGHREIAAFAGDAGIEARILWRGIQMILYVLPRGATPGLSWAEHPLANLLEIARFFLDSPSAAWCQWAP